jgi:hypothetical protein
MMLDRTARPSPHTLFLHVQLMKNSSMPGIPHPPGRSCCFKQELPELLDTQQHGRVSSNRPLRQFQQEQR